MPTSYLKAPLVSFEKKKDANSVGSLVWRTITGSIIIYSLYSIGIHEYKVNDVTNYWSAWLTNALDPNGSW
jgi:hypothetical protein